MKNKEIAFVTTLILNTRDNKVIWSPGLTAGTLIADDGNAMLTLSVESRHLAVFVDGEYDRFYIKKMLCDQLLCRIKNQGNVQITAEDSEDTSNAVDLGLDKMLNTLSEPVPEHKPAWANYSPAKTTEEDNHGKFDDQLEFFSKKSTLFDIKRVVQPTPGPGEEDTRLISFADLKPVKSNFIPDPSVIDAPVMKCNTAAFRKLALSIFNELLKEFSMNPEARYCWIPKYLDNEDKSTIYGFMYTTEMSETTNIWFIIMKDTRGKIFLKCIYKTTENVTRFHIDNFHDKSVMQIFELITAPRVKELDEVEEAQEVQQEVQSVPVVLPRNKFPLDTKIVETKNPYDFFRCGLGKVAKHFRKDFARIVDNLHQDTIEGKINWRVQTNYFGEGVHTSFLCDYPRPGTVINNHSVAKPVTCLTFGEERVYIQIFCPGSTIKDPNIVYGPIYNDDKVKAIAEILIQPDIRKNLEGVKPVNMETITTVLGHNNTEFRLETVEGEDIIVIDLPDSKQGDVIHVKAKDGESICEYFNDVNEERIGPALMSKNLFGFLSDVNVIGRHFNENVLNRDHWSLETKSGGITLDDILEAISANGLDYEVQKLPVRTNELNKRLEAKLKDNRFFEFTYTDEDSIRVFICTGGINKRIYVNKFKNMSDIISLLTLFNK